MISIEDTVPPTDILEDAWAIVPVSSAPTGLCIITVGLVEYPSPPSEITIEVIVPAIETIAVAAAPITES